MYEKFYNLSKQPFHVTPDPEFLYLSESHKQALASIMYGIEKRKGFVAITGAVGVGKTTIVRAYLERATTTQLQLIYLFHANVTFTDLVKTIYRELGLELAATDPIEMVNDLHLALIELYRQGKSVVVIIDEAQNMPMETLENLRMLSNLETPTDKLIQVVLVGQTELEELLGQHGLRQLNQRIAIRAHIAPLSAQESYAYIRHRLSVAGLDKPTIFSEKALRIVVREAKGIPRTLNILCDNALITGFGYQKNPVTASIAREVVTDCAGTQRRSPVRKWKVAALAGVAVFLAFAVAISLSPYRHGAVEMLGDVGLWQATKPEPAPSRVTLMPPAGQLPVILVPAAAPPSESTQVEGPKTGTTPQPEGGARRRRGAPAASYKTRVVKRGETLSGLIREVYHTSPNSALEDSLIHLVKQHNPAIIDSDLILAGSVIRFPEPPKEQ